jgi:hypothetical protein
MIILRIFVENGKKALILPERLESEQFMPEQGL